VALAERATIASHCFAKSSCATDGLNTIVVDKAISLEKLGPLGCGIQTGAGTVLIAPGQTRHERRRTPR